MLRKYIEENKEKRNDYMDISFFCYNILKHESTKYTAPFEIMFCRENTDKDSQPGTITLLTRVQ